MKYWRRLRCHTCGSFWHWWGPEHEIRFHERNFRQVHAGHSIVEVKS